MGLEKLFENSLKNNLRLFFGDFSGRRFRSWWCCRNVATTCRAESYDSGKRSYRDKKVGKIFSRSLPILGGKNVVWPYGPHPACQFFDGEWVKMTHRQSTVSIT